MNKIKDSFNEKGQHLMNRKMHRGGAAVLSPLVENITSALSHKKLCSPFSLNQQDVSRT